MLDQVVLTLQSRVGQRTYLVASELKPFPLVEHLIEASEAFRFQEVNERIADVAFTLRESKLTL